MFSVSIRESNNGCVLEIMDSKHKPIDVFVNISEHDAEEMEDNIKLLLKRFAKDYEPSI